MVRRFFAGLIVIFTLTLISEAAFAQTSSTRRRTSSTSRSSAPMTSEECVATGCPCCIFMSASRGTVCRSDGQVTAQTEELWGTSRVFIVNGRTFNLFNGTEAQLNKISEIIRVLPNAYLEALPNHFRIGNPRNGSKNAPDDDTSTIGGGSRRCFVRNADYEYIIIHPAVFTNTDENPALTILHEAGHFIDKYHRISANVIAAHRDEFSRYLATYRGDTRGNDEVIAQGVMYYFYRKYLRTDRRGNLKPFATTGRTGRFPTWLSNIIEADIQSRS